MKHLNLSPVLAIPVIHLARFVIRSVILNVINSVPSTVEMSQHLFLKKAAMRRNIECFVLYAIDKVSCSWIYCPENLLTVTLPFCWNLRLGIEMGPGSVDRGGLAECGLVLEYYYGSFFEGFFFTLG